MTTDQQRAHAPATPRRSRKGTWAVALAVPVGVVASGALVWNASYAAFTATTGNTGNTWTTGSVALTDDDSSTALFQLSGPIAPRTDQRCITVTYTGDLAASVAFSAAAPDDALATAMTAVVDTGTGDNATCSGFTDDGSADLYSGSLAGLESAAAGTWTAPGTTTKTYRITVTVPDAAPQGQTTNASFSWTATSS